MDNTELAIACREIVAHFEGDVAITLFEYYDAINRHFFNGNLPQAFILTALTPYGRCDGLTKHYHKQPIVLIHPTLKTEQERFYTLVHEAIHVYVRYCLGYTGKKSHDSIEWLEEINRIAPMLGYHGVTIGESKVVRAKGGGTKRTDAGNVPYKCSWRFPDALAEHLQKPLPPYEQWL